MTFEILERRIDWGWGRRRSGNHGIMFVAPETDRPALCVSVPTTAGGTFEVDSFAWPDRLRYRLDVVGD